MLGTEKEALERLQKIRTDPWEFLKAVKTLDQVDQVNPIKPFPVHREYLKLYCKIFLKERLILIPKSRRMTMTWTTIALITWDCMFNIGRQWAVVSKKESDSDDLVKRVDFIIKNLDYNIIPKDFVPPYTPTFCKLEFPQMNSKILGFPSGSDQLRQFTFSGILADEMAFWDDAESMFSSAKPTIEGKNGQGGKFIGISSAGPGFFQRLVQDTVNDDVTDFQPNYEGSV